MRKFLLLSLLFLMLAVVAIVIFAMVSRRPGAMLACIVPAVLFLPLLLVYLIVAASSGMKQRRQGMADAAERLGFFYSPDVSESLTTATTGFVLMEGQPQLSDEIRGERDGISICVFSCCKSYFAGDHAQTRFYPVALLPIQVQGVPSFALTPETVWERIGKAVGGEDINFRGSQVCAAFSKQFVLRSFDGANEQEVRGFFNERLMEFFTKRNAGCLQVARDSLMVWLEPAFGRELTRGLRSIRSNVAEDAETVLQQAMEIRAALVERASVLH